MLVIRCADVMNDLSAQGIEGEHIAVLEPATTRMKNPSIPTLNSICFKIYFSYVCLFFFVIN